jgi:hypothetical protein
VSVKEISKSEHTIILSFDERVSEYSSIQIQMDNNSTLKKVVMFYNVPIPVDPDNDKSAKAKPRVEIVYSEINMNALAGNIEADEKIYITKNKEGYSPSLKYKGYRVINQRLKG